jgi:MEMO1 family protein
MRPEQPGLPAHEHAADPTIPIDPALLGAWIDRRIEEGTPIGGNAPPRAVITPHIDPGRGARVYGSAFRALRGHPAERIVILGVGHAIGRDPFSIDDQPIITPWGACPVDGDVIRELCADLPFDPIAAAREHAAERSILHQALFLRRALDGWAYRRVVPILCSFPWAPGPRREETAAAMERFADRLAASLDDRTLVVAGVDLAHVGGGHGDGPIDLDVASRETERLDLELLARIADGDMEGFEDRMDREADARRICGYPVMRTLMRILHGASGIVIDYGQSIDAAGGTLVSYAAMVLR